MPTFAYIWLFLCLVCVLGFGYNLYQFDRNGEVLRIQIKWVKNKDKGEKKWKSYY